MMGKALQSCRFFQTFPTGYVHSDPIRETSGRLIGRVWASQAEQSNLQMFIKGDLLGNLLFILTHGSEI